MDKLLDLTRDFDAAKAAFETYLDCSMILEDLNRLNDLTALNREPWSMQHMVHSFCSDRRK